MPEHLITCALQVKYCVLLCGDDIDPHVRQMLFDDQKFLLNIRSKVVKAASGALAMLTSASNKICNKVFSSYLLGLTSSHLFGMYCTFIFSCMLHCTPGVRVQAVERLPAQLARQHRRRDRVARRGHRPAYGRRQQRCCREDP